MADDRIVALVIKILDVVNNSDVPDRPALSDKAKLWALSKAAEVIEELRDDNIILEASAAEKNASSRRIRMADIEKRNGHAVEIEK